MFHQVIPQAGGLRIGSFSGEIETMNDLLRWAYDPKHGWKRSSIY